MATLLAPRRIRKVVNYLRYYWSLYLMLLLPLLSSRFSATSP